MSTPRAAREQPAWLQRAITLHRQGRLDEAEALYRRLLKRRPGDADALHFLGLLSHQRGDTAAAIELVRRATASAPGYVDALNNLGNLLRVAGRFEEAETAYRRAIALRPDDANAHSNLGAVLKAQGNTADAEAALRRAIELDDHHVPALTNLGNLLNRVGRAKEALGYYYAAVAFNPRHPDAPRVLGLAYQASGDLEKARGVFSEWLKRDPGNPVAAHMLRACTGEDAPDRAPDDYVRTVFDDMATAFDEHLADLDYQAPRLVAEAFARAWPAPRGDLDVLDAGCGTGLCGAFLRPRARTLIGVDLSRGMLNRARSLKIYDELVDAELTVFLEAHTGTYDVIVSADTLCYFGALDRLFAAAAGALRPEGRLLFTVEKAVDPEETDYRLQPHGRYCHAEEYVALRLECAGLAVRSIGTDRLRRESGKDVAGLIVTAAKP